MVPVQENVYSSEMQTGKDADRGSRTWRGGKKKMFRLLPGGLCGVDVGCGGKLKRGNQGGGEKKWLEEHRRGDETSGGRQKRKKGGKPLPVSTRDT